jgi:hypothetical protein
MDRQGEFKILATGPNHCGVVEDLAIKYQMICECNTTLDRRGFLFDQINVDKYFQNIKRSQLSCEKLVQQCTKDLLRLIKEENPRCVIRKVDLTLSPFPFLASMKFSWTNPRLRNQ